MCRRLPEEELKSGEETPVIFDILTQSLSPTLAQEVKESWVNPNALYLKHILGNG